MEFDFETDRESHSYCAEIVELMVQFFGVSEDEAVARLNNRWRGTRKLGRNTMLYHKEPDFWAKDLYYGYDVNWWISEEGLKPEPLPNNEPPKT